MPWVGLVLLFDAQSVTNSVCFFVYLLRLITHMYWSNTKKSLSDYSLFHQYQARTKRKCLSLALKEEQNLEQHYESGSLPLPIAILIFHLSLPTCSGHNRLLTLFPNLLHSQCVVHSRHIKHTYWIRRGNALILSCPHIGCWLCLKSSFSSCPSGKPSFI